MDDPTNDSPVTGTVDVQSPAADSVDTTPTAESKRIADTNSSIKDVQRQLHELTQLRAELRGEVNVLKAMKTPEKQEEQDWFAARNWSEKLKTGMEHDPAAAVSESLDTAVQNLRRDMVMLADARDNALKEEIRRMVAEATNPEVNEYREVMSELAKEIPSFDSLPKDSQIAMAKMYAKSKPAASTVSRATPPVSFGKSSRGVSVDSSVEAKRRDEQLNANVTAIFGSLNKQAKGIVEVN